MRTLLLGLSLLVATPAQAQEGDSLLYDSFVELLRADLQVEAREVLTFAMDLADGEGALFWPIYDDYVETLRPVGDERIRLIEMYGKNYDTLTDEVAADIADHIILWEKHRAKAREKAYKKVKKVKPAVKGPN